MNIFVSGSLAYDRIMDFPGKFSDHILPKKIHQINVSFGLDTLNVQCGGTAGNIAYSLALLGQKPYIISQVGTDFGDYTQWLKQHHLPLDFITTISKERTATAHIITDQRDNQIAGFYFGAMRQAVVDNKTVVKKITKKVVQKKDIGLIAAGNIKDMLELAKIYRSAHVPYIFDPGQQTVWLAAPQFRAILAGAHTLIVNDYELALVEKKLHTTAQKLRAQLTRLIVTQGEKGATWWEGKQKTTMPVAQPVQVVDPTGAGDAYRAGVIVGQLKGWDSSTTGRVAALCATYAIEQYGTQQHQYTAQQFSKRFYQTFNQKISL